MKIQPTSRPKTSLSTWEVLDNKNKLVGTFDANKDETAANYTKLMAIVQVQNIVNDLSDVRKRVTDLIHGRKAWQINDRALQACDLTRQALNELDSVIQYIKES